MMERTGSGGRPRRQRPGVLGAGLAAIGLLVTGCTAGDPSDQPRDVDATAHTPVPVDDPVDPDAVAGVLATLAFGSPVPESGAGVAECLAARPGGSGFTPAGAKVLVAGDHHDLGAAALALRDHGHPDDAELLLSTELQERLDQCRSGVLLDDADPVPAGAYAPPGSVAPPGSGEPDMEPSIDIRPDESITSTGQLVDGIAVTFGSYARDEEQRLVYVAASECLAQHVFDTGFDAETLRFLAAGRPLGTGSVAEMLPVEADRATWASSEFTTGMVDCIEAVTSEDITEARTDEDGSPGSEDTGF